MSLGTPIQCLGALTLVVLPIPAAAIDGVIEINQACAVNTGCMPGDAAAFPVTISAAGSYVLTSSLVVSGATPAITVTATDVDIDLNGFRLQGPKTCTGSGSGVSCSGGSAGNGIDPNGADGVSVRRGTIQGFADGINLGDRTSVTEVTAIGNSGAGISVGDFSSITNSKMLTNFFDGLRTAGVGVGIHVTGCTAVGNRLRGIGLGQESTVSDFVSMNNGGDGVECANACLVRDGVARGNGGDGVDASFHSQIRGNVIRLNTGFGIRISVGSGTTYDHNTINSNTAGTVTGALIDMGSNSCNATASCP